MENPGNAVPQLPAGLQDRLDQINRLIEDLQRDLEGISQDPVDDTFIPPWKKPVNQKDLEDILAFLRERDKFPGGLRPRPGLRIGGVEMTQSIQFYDLYGQGSQVGPDNSVPLVAGKDLILRAYVERRTGGITSPPTQFDGVVRYAGKTVKSLNGPNPVQDAAALRRNLPNDSLNFRIPGADCFGKRTFTVEVFDALKPTTFNRTSFRVTADFFDVPRMRVSGVLFSFTGNNLNLPAPTGLDLVNSLARFLPMLPLQGFDYNVCTVENFDQDLTMAASWENLLKRVANLRSSSTIRTFYVGLLPANVTVLTGSSTRGKGNVGLAVAARDDTRALSHELGHACNFDHVDAGSPPAPLDKQYPTYGTYSFGSIGEMGVDSARFTLYNPNYCYDFMTYWENGSPPPLFTANTWISPYNYRRMMQFLKLTDGNGDIIIAGIIIAQVILLNFRVYRDGRVEIQPSYPVGGVPYTRDARPEVGLMLDLYNREGALIGSYRCHQHDPYQDPDGPYLDFHEVLPWPEAHSASGVGEIVFARGREELSRVRVSDDPPVVRLEGVRRVERGEGEGDLARVEWSLGEGSGEREQPAALVRYTHDGGHTWQAVAADAREPRCLVNLDLLPGGEDCRFQVTVSAGLAASVIESEPFAVRRKPRRAYIASPQNGETFRAGDPVVFAGAGHSPDYGTSTTEEGSWSSSLEGVIGTGVYLVRTDLHPGTHRITLSTPDGQSGEQGGEASASVWIKVVEAEC